MPTRLVREGKLTSESVNLLTYPAEVFYDRLMLVADDHGRYDARPSVLRARLFPLRLDKVRESDIETWIRATVEAGLVRQYTVESRQFLEISKFKQPLRSKSKWPDPPKDREMPAEQPPVPTLESGKQLKTGVCMSCAAPDTDTDTDIPNSSLERGKGENLFEEPPPPPPEITVETKARIALHWLNQKASRFFRERTQNLTLAQARLEEVDGDIEGVKKMIDRMCARWKGTEQEEFLRPSTLFRKSNFHEYYDLRDVPIAPNGKPHPEVNHLAGF